MSTDRTHFVYRAYDEYGVLLYIGCTKQPETRWKQHSGKRFAQYARRFRLVGPLPKAEAFLLEGRLIEAERPHFNSLLEHKRVGVERRNMQSRLMATVRAAQPDLFPRTGDAYDPTVMDAYLRLCEQINEQVDAEIPPMDDAWRHANYLGVRRIWTVRPA